MVKCILYLREQCNSKFCAYFSINIIIPMDISTTKTIVSIQIFLYRNRLSFVKDIISKCIYLFFHWPTACVRWLSLYIWPFECGIVFLSLSNYKAPICSAPYTNEWVAYFSLTNSMDCGCDRNKREKKTMICNNRELAKRAHTKICILYRFMLAWNFCVLHKNMHPTGI